MKTYYLSNNSKALKSQKQALDKKKIVKTSLRFLQKLFKVSLSFQFNLKTFNLTKVNSKLSQVYDETEKK